MMMTQTKQKQLRVVAEVRRPETRHGNVTQEPTAGQIFFILPFLLFRRTGMYGVRTVC